MRSSGPRRNRGILHIQGDYRLISGLLPLRRGQQRVFLLVGGLRWNVDFGRAQPWFSQRPGVGERTHKGGDQVKYAMNIEMVIDIEIMTE